MKMSLTQEIATRKVSIDFYSLNLYLPNPDPILKKMGKDIRVYRDLVSDGRVFSGVVSRKSGVTSLEWRIDKGKAKSRQAKIIEDCFKNFNMHDVMSQFLDAVLYGYAPQEVVWKRYPNGLLLPERIVAKPPEWFVFGIDNELRFRSRKNWINGDEVAPRKFLLPRNLPTYQNPYGEPVLSRCFWPVTFKKGGWRFWVTFAEKFGTPFIVGKHPRGAQDKEINDLVDNLSQMVQDAIAAIPVDSEVEIIESGGKSASSDLYHNLVQEAKSEISEVLVGHAGAAESTPGKLGNENAALMVRQDIIDSDKKIVEATFNELIRWICELNWGGGEIPTFGLFKDEEVDQKLAMRDAVLTKDCEVKLSQPYYEREYGFKPGDIVSVGGPAEPAAIVPAPEATIQKTPVEFAEAAEPFPGEPEMDELAGAVPAEVLQSIVEGILQPVFKLFKESGDLTETMGALIKLYPEMNTDELTELLARIIFVSEVWGRLQADE